MLRPESGPIQTETPPAGPPALAAGTLRPDTPRRGAAAGRPSIRSSRPDGDVRAGRDPRGVRRRLGAPRGLRASDGLPRLLAGLGADDGGDDVALDRASVAALPGIARGD